MRDVYILSGARTPFTTWTRGRRGDGRRGGALADKDPLDLGAAALRGALDKAELPAQAVDRLVFGNMYQDGPHACYGAMYVGHRAGLPDRTQAMTLHMACGTGLNVVIEAAKDVRSGEASVVAAAGADVPSRISKDIFLPSFFDLSCGQAIGWTVETLSKKAGLSREEMDRWAAVSHARALEARSEGRLAEEIVPVGSVREDDGILAGENLSKLKSSRVLKGGAGLITAGNTHGIVDGGSALILAADKNAGDARPLGRFLAGAYAGVAPEQMGLASVPAVRGILKQIGAEPDQIDLYEINETFSAQLLLDIREFGIPEDRVNVNGGAIALGHPFAGTGPRQVLALLLELRRRGLRRGIACICVGGGQGVALAVESL